MSGEAMNSGESEQIEIVINGENSTLRPDGLTSMGDLIELVKASIDPDHMITGLLINGKELDDNDWSASLQQIGTAIIEVETGTPADYVSSRFAQAGHIVASCFNEFREARKAFQSGDMNVGNRKLVGAVNTLKAFFEWYSSMVDLVPESEKSRYSIGSFLTEITEICKSICQQQLYQSWWALGESIEKELEPKLDQLEDFCRRFAVQES